MIRKIKKEDLTNIMTIWVKGNFKANYFIDKDYWLVIFNEMKDNFLYKYTTFVYEENDEIKGFISLNNCEIKAIYVKEIYTRNGIGKKLLNYCKNFCNILSLKVYEKNINAFLFFSNFGFKNRQISIEDIHNEKIFIMEWEKTT